MCVEASKQPAQPHSQKIILGFFQFVMNCILTSQAILLFLIVLHSIVKLFICYLWLIGCWENERWSMQIFLKYLYYSCILQQWFPKPICPRMRKSSTDKGTLHQGSRDTGSIYQDRSRTYRSLSRSSCWYQRLILMIFNFSSGCEDEIWNPNLEK